MSETRPTLLVVDDADVNVDVLLEALGDEYIVRVAGDGASALAAVSRALPDLVLLDIMMPGMDGFEVCRRLKADPISRNIPVIFLTALAEETDEARGLELGAVDYMTKPFNPSIVRARIHTHLELKAHRDALEALVGQRTRELFEAHRRLKALDAARREYLSAIAYELRTPANGVLGVAELALWELTDPGQQATLTALFADSRQRLLATIDAAMQLGQLDGDAGPVELAPVDLTGILAACAGELHGDYVAKRLSFVAPASEPRFVLGHGALLGQSITTLLKIAQRMANPGTPVSAQFGREPDRVSLTIAWECAPVSEELRRTFFETFSRDRASSAVEDLGLSGPLAAHVIKATGGRMDLRHTTSGLAIHVSLLRGFASESPVR